MTTKLDQSITDEQPRFARICMAFESMLDSLPPNSSIGSHNDGYIVRTPIGIAIAPTVAEAYQEAMRMVSAKEAR